MCLQVVRNCKQILKDELMDQQGLSTAEYENQTVLQYFKYLSVSMEGE